jgi:hypothetical protein
LAKAIQLNASSKKILSQKESVHFRFQREHLLLLLLFRFQREPCTLIVLMNNQQAPLPPSQSKPPKTLFLLILHTCHILSISMILIFDPPPDDPSSPPPLRCSTRPKKKSIKAGFDYSLLLLAALHAGTLGTLTPYAANYRFPSAYHGNAKITRYSLDRKKFLGATWAPVQIAFTAGLVGSVHLPL